MNQANKESDRLFLNGDRSTVRGYSHEQSKLIHSGKASPCPICDRTKDADCSWSGDRGMVLCHTQSGDPPATINGYQFKRMAGSGLHGANSAAMYVKINEQKPIRQAEHKAYIYDGNDGHPLVKVTRIDDGKGKKTFSQSHYIDGAWKTGCPKNVQLNLHLYRFNRPINRKAIENGQPLLIVEGEGKVDLLHLMGIAATCSIGGAGKWKAYGYPNYLKDLEGASVVIVPDRDKPGMDHALAIAQDFPDAQWLYPFPESQLWNNLPTKGGLDIADWITDYRLSKEEVLAAIGPYREPATPNLTPESTTTQDKAKKVARASKTQIDHDAIQEVLGNRLRLNELCKQIELDGKPVDLNTAKIELAVEHGLDLYAGADETIHLLAYIAKQRRYHPVVDYLNHVESQYGNDTKVLEGMAARYLGASDPIYQIILIRFLIAAVARAYEPGCKHDHVLVLHGDEGLRKSAFLKTLASPEWFDDTYTRKSNDDEKLKLHTVWITEWAEIEEYLRIKGSSAVKAFITSTTDRVRPPYGRVHEVMNRGGVLTASTNEDHFLVSTTGNRRFWIIPVSKAIDVDTLLQERDRIWAAAVSLYRMGEQWWLTPEEEELTAEDKEAYQQLDPWHSRVEKYCEEHDPVSTGEILEKVLEIELKDHDPQRKRRVASILRLLGFKPAKSTRMHWGEKQRVWERGLNSNITVPSVPEV